MAYRAPRRLKPFQAGAFPKNLVRQEKSGIARASKAVARKQKCPQPWETDSPSRGFLRYHPRQSLTILP
jgi:hypothetical protein